MISLKTITATKTSTATDTVLDILREITEEAKQNEGWSTIDLIPGNDFELQIEAIVISRLFENLAGMCASHDLKLTHTTLYDREAETYYTLKFPHPESSAPVAENYYGSFPLDDKWVHIFYEVPIEGPARNLTFHYSGHTFTVGYTASGKIIENPYMVYALKSSYGMEIALITLRDVCQVGK